jgi:transcriptional regulator GlxA family with amidase domain
MVHGAFECVSLRFRERRGGAGRQLRLRSAVADFLATLLAECTGEHPGGDSQVPAVRRAVRFMHSRLRSPDLDLGAVAAAAGLSPHHFGRVFQRELGLSPMRYLRDLRLDAAGDLLRTTSLRVCEVAEEVGFRDPLHFSRVWHRCCGLSPTAYRDSRRAMAPAP